MRNSIVNLLKWLLTMLEADNPTFVRANELVMWADVEYPNVRGERKRHQVINRLATEFPDRSLRYLAYQIEKALQEK